MTHPAGGHKRIALLALGLIIAAALDSLLLADHRHREVVQAATVVRKQIEPGMIAAIQGGHKLYLECRPPRGDAAKAFFLKSLANPEDWESYKDRVAVAVPFSKLNPATRRAVLEAVFPYDYADEAGWWHTVTYGGADGLESWWSLSEWFTGMGTNHNVISQIERNQHLTLSLERGQKILFPRELLLDVLKAPSKQPVVEPLAPGAIAGPPELVYGDDDKGAYAAYKIKRGEAIYTSVVARFTEYSENAEVLSASELILARSGIRNARKIKEGQRILIPVEMLSDRYRPEGSKERLDYEAMRQEVKRLQATHVRSKDLADVVIILDPGHGGKDHGAYPRGTGLYEDEITYDIACRIKRLLEENTEAAVYMTLIDKSQGYTVSDKKRFIHDRDEELLTTPRYKNTDGARVSANLRWHLTNQIYLKERARGVPDRNILFASIHCESLYSGLRGAMVYVPGAKYRKQRKNLSGTVYARHGGGDAVSFATDYATCRRDEALSIDFAETLLESLRNYRVKIKVHDTGDPLRNVIRQSGGVMYVPAVLNYNHVPTKVLIEAANLGNAIDRQRVADPKWRQWFAEAMVEAIRKHFNSNGETQTLATLQ